MTVPSHLESTVNSLRDRDLNKNNIWTHELELIQIRAIQASQGTMINTSCTLIAGDPMKKIEASSSLDKANRRNYWRDRWFVVGKWRNDWRWIVHYWRARKNGKPLICFRFKRIQPFKARPQSRRKAPKRFFKSGFKSGTMDMSYIHVHSMQWVGTLCYRV